MLRSPHASTRGLLFVPVVPLFLDQSVPCCEQLHRAAGSRVHVERSNNPKISQRRKPIFSRRISPLAVVRAIAMPRIGADVRRWKTKQLVEVTMANLPPRCCGSRRRAEVVARSSSEADNSTRSQASARCTMGCVMPQRMSLSEEEPSSSAPPQIVAEKRGPDHHGGSIVIIKRCSGPRRRLPSSSRIGSGCRMCCAERALPPVRFNTPSCCHLRT